jgi:hypothetical protein
MMVWKYPDTLPNLNCLAFWYQKGGVLYCRDHFQYQNIIKSVQQSFEWLVVQFEITFFLKSKLLSKDSTGREPNRTTQLKIQFPKRCKPSVFLVIEFVTKQEIFDSLHEFQW